MGPGKLSKSLVGICLAGIAVGPALAHQAVPPKAQQTDAQRKISSNLLDAIRGRKSDVLVDHQHRALIDIRVKVTPELAKSVARLGGKVVSSSTDLDTLLAWVPLKRIERLAARDDVKSIHSAPRSIGR